MSGSPLPASYQDGPAPCYGSGPRWPFVTALAFAVVAAVAIATFLAWTQGLVTAPYPFPWWPPFVVLGFWLFVLLVARPWGWGWRRGGWGYAYHWPGARELVRLRFARGEISRDEMDRMLAELDGRST